MEKYEKSALNLCLFYIIYIFLYGIVIKLTFSNSVLFQLKTFIPETILVLVVLLSSFRNGIKLKSFLLPLLGYSIIVFLVNLAIYGLNQQVLYWIRDLYVPLVAFCFLLTVKFSSDGMQQFSTKLVFFFKLYLIAGLVLALVQQIQGWEWASSFYTGYTFYGQDEVSKIKIAHNMAMLRAPSLSGNFATFGYYCLIAAVFIDAKANSIWKKLFWDIIAVLCMFFATNKSAIVAFLVVLTLRQTVNLRNRSKWLNNIILVLIAGFLGITTIMFLGDDSSGQNILISLYTRFDIWKNILADTSILETLFPYKQFMYGSGVEGGGGFFDNTYLYSLITQGIIGTLLWVYVLGKVYKSQMKFGNLMVRHYVYELTIALLVLGLTVNVTQGRGFLSSYLVLLAVGFSIVGGEYVELSYSSHTNFHVIILNGGVQHEYY